MAEASAGGKRGPYVRTDYARRVAAVARVCRRMEAGEGIWDVCRDPTMPARSTLMSWLARYEELAAQVAAVREACPEMRRATYHYWSPEVGAEVLARIVDGRGLNEVCAEPDMPAAATVHRWLNERPEFAAAYTRAREAQADRLFDLAWRIACDVDEEVGPGALAAARLRIETLKWRVGRLAPRKYGPSRLLETDGDGRGKGGKGDGPVGIEVRRFALAPEGVRDITRHIRGMDEDQIRAFQHQVEAGAPLADLGPLAADERIEGCFLLRGGARAA